MGLLKSTRQTFSLSLEGLREATLAIAERVTARVQRGKLQLQADEAHVRLQHAYESLGHSLYTVHTVRTPPRSGDPPEDEVLQLCQRIHSEQRTLQGIRDRLAAQDDDILVVPLARLHEDLKEGGGTVERVTVSPAAQADGKCLRELALPEEVQIVALRRGNVLLFPTATVVLRAGDQITIVGTRSAVSTVLQSLRA